jgi:molybdopterin synthase sulfur carrier subunit
MRVVLPSPLFSYTRGQKEIEATGDSLAQLLLVLDRRYPGLRHRIIDEQGRIRPHIRFFVNGEGAATLDRALRAEDEVLIVAALSGG